MSNISPAQADQILQQLRGSTNTLLANAYRVANQEGGKAGWVNIGTGEVVDRFLETAAYFGVNGVSRGEGYNAEMARTQMKQWGILKTDGTKEDLLLNIGAIVAASSQRAAGVSM